MATKSIVKTNEYHDSVSLMAVASKLSSSPGVHDVAVIMATESNKALLDQAGLLTPDAVRASPNDLAIVVNADEAVIDKLLIEAESLHIIITGVSSAHTYSEIIHREAHRDGARN